MCNIQLWWWLTQTARTSCIKQSEVKCTCQNVSQVVLNNHLISRCFPLANFKKKKKNRGRESCVGYFGKKNNSEVRHKRLLWRWMFHKFWKLICWVWWKMNGLKQSDVLAYNTVQCSTTLFAAEGSLHSYKLFVCTHHCNLSAVLVVTEIIAYS